MESYCGKSCETCGWREKLACPGCQGGPARSGSCDVAACCREKGHTACSTCGFLAGCTRRAGLDRVPERRQRRMEADAARRRELDRRAPVLGKWLWLLFWLFIPSELATLMSNDTVAAAFPALGMAGEVLGLLCGLAYAMILWLLRKTGERYRIAAICQAVAAVAAALLAAVSARDMDGGLTLLMELPTIAVSLLAVYQEYNAHADVLEGLDDMLSEKWRGLWKWYIGLLIGLFACVILVAIAGILGLLATLAAIIGIVIVSILKLVYLYRTAKLFRNYVPSETGRLEA